MTRIPNPGQIEVQRDSDFATDQFYIDAMLNNYVSVLQPNGCIDYNYNLNSDGYARIRYSIPGDFRRWSDGSFVYFQSGTRAPYRKRRDYRIYLHRYLFWRDLMQRQDYLLPHQFTISHLCSNKICGNHHHYYPEHILVNLSRIECAMGLNPICFHYPICIP